jgi:hypothetical protein
MQITLRFPRIVGLLVAATGHRLTDPCVHGAGDRHDRVQGLLRDPRLPRPREA